MLDIALIRENPEKVKEGVTKKGYDPTLVDKVLELDKKRIDLLQKVDALRGERNKVSEQRGADGSTSSPQGSEQRGREIKEELKKLEPELNQVEEEYNLALREIPNLPLDDVPVGKGESENKVTRKWGEPKKFSFAPKDYLELGQLLGIIDVQHASRVSGTRFGYLLGDAVLLEFALVNFAIGRLVKEGFTPVLPPMLIKKEITDGLGYWHGGGNENYYYVLDFQEGDGQKELSNPLYLVGTGEHSIVPMHGGEVIDVPKKYVAFSSCFRREAGSYGKDVRGILRVHQFDKVEMVQYVKPEEGERAFNEMVKISEELMQELELPYQVVDLTSGDLGFPTARTYDLETWMPGQGKYRETHSISTTTDYQARALGIKYRAGNQTEFVHILNGTAFAIGRTIIAILENYQQKDGSVVVPEVLRPYMGKDKITA